MKVITIANQKGGAAKTTTAGALSTALKRKGYSVLAIDMDPQSNLSDHFGAQKKEKLHILAAMKGETRMEDVIQSTRVGDIAPSSRLLSSLEKEPNGTGVEFWLRDAIRRANFAEKYDYVIIDTPTALGIILINALVAADYILIPMLPDLDYIKGLSDLNRSILTVSNYYNTGLKIAGILLTRFDVRTNNSKSVRDIALKYAGEIKTKVFDTIIRSSVVISESHAGAVDLWEFKANSTVAKDYNAFCMEFLKEVEIDG